MDSMNLHAHYPDVIKHWSVVSERFAGGDALLTKLRKGWDIDGAVYAEEFWHAGTRPVTVYHFMLTRGDEQIVMPVVTTPYVRRMISSWKLDVRPYDEYRALMQKQRRMTVGA
ncbi:MAG: hypothetical protein SGI73_17490 [Chloroflexota bacterium]|nr:hypothetical protein [Chloroflexota bacterium]